MGATTNKVERLMGLYSWLTRNGAKQQSDRYRTDDPLLIAMMQEIIDAREPEEKLEEVLLSGYPQDVLKDQLITAVSRLMAGKKPFRPAVSEDTILKALKPAYLTDDDDESVLTVGFVPRYLTPSTIVMLYSKYPKADVILIRLDMRESKHLADMPAPESKHLADTPAPESKHLADTPAPESQEDENPYVLDDL